MRIPGFEMLEKLGQGGMATVWKARQVSLDRIVAIKIMSSKKAMDPTDVQMFLNEAQSTAKLKHPGIIQVYDANVQEGACYYIMEYIAGYTVGDWIRRKKRVPEKEALLVIECVAEALNYGWEREKIIHCDIKPDNVMVDSDGTIKVADLGLSRTFSAMSSGGFLDEIMGTAAYMSPEQAQGHADLDCRTDIYSLGAMLYYMLTGQMLFDGRSDDAMMELQVTGTVPDALEVNPELSRPVGWLLERMLMKDPGQRQENWNGVLADVARVKKHLMPTGGPCPEGRSTVARGRRRTPADFAATPPKAVEEKKSPLLWILLLVVFAGVGIVVWLIVGAQKPAKPVAPVKPVTPVKVFPGPADEDAKGMFDFARRWAVENPDRHDEIIRKFKDVKDQTQGTKYALMAQEEIRKAAAARKEASDRLMASLDGRAGVLKQELKFEAAARVYEDYQGALAEETAKLRVAAALTVRNAGRDYAANQKKRAETAGILYGETLDRIAQILMTGGVPEAKKALADAQQNPELQDCSDKLQGLVRLVDDVADVDKRILASFKAQAGREAKVELTSGTKTLAIVDVVGVRVSATQKFAGTSASVPVTFTVADLTAREKVLRLGPEETGGVALVKGLLAVESKAYPQARKYFAACDPAIADRLVAVVDKFDQKAVSDEAEKALAQVMKLAGVAAPGPFDPEAWADALNGRKLTPAATTALAGGLAGFKARYGTSEFARQAEPVIAALGVLGGVADASAKNPDAGDGKPDRPAALPSVSLPAESAVARGNGAAILALMLKKNPGLREGNIRLDVEEDKVRGVTISGGRLETIAPLAALSDLKVFNAPGQDSLKDLLGLRGLPLEAIDVDGTKVADLAPLRGMPLRRLNVMDTSVRDLSPLRGGTRLEWVNIRNTKVYDLQPLVGMPVKVLDVTDSQVKNIAVIKSLPLEDLNIANTKVFDFSPIAEVRTLKRLGLAGTQFKNLETLQGLSSLVALDLSGTSVTELSPIQGMNLRQLSLAGTGVKDFSVLRNLPLQALNVTGTRMKDLAVLEGKRLDVLILSGTDVTDLSVLKGMPLVHVGIDLIKVGDLSALKGGKLKFLNCGGQTSDLIGQLAGLPIERIWCDREIDSKWLMSIFPQLQLINNVDMVRPPAPPARPPAK